jgi:hypothetical protein
MGGMPHIMITKLQSEADNKARNDETIGTENAVLLPTFPPRQSLGVEPARESQTLCGSNYPNNEISIPSFLAGCVVALLYQVASFFQ